jgi:hypothetical protein
MKILFWGIVLMLCPLTMWAQSRPAAPNTTRTSQMPPGTEALLPPSSSGGLGAIELGVVMPDAIEGLDNGQLSRLESKIVQIVTTSGVSASNYTVQFVIYPKFTVYETDVAEGGMQNVTVVTAELSLFIKQIDNGSLFGSMIKKIRGGGKNAQSALNNAITSISATDSQFKNFIAAAQKKIVQHYEAKCADLQKKAENLASMKRYDEAVGILAAIPSEVSCWPQVQSRLIGLYKLYQDKQCVRDIQNAQIELAANNYTAALRLLSRVDPSSACFGQVQDIVKSIDPKVDEEDKRIWEAQMKIYGDAVELEKHRMSAIKDVAVAYYQSKTSNVTYNYLIK